MNLLKKWLGLTRSTSVAVLHHPDVIGVPHLPQLQTKAKLTFLASVVSSEDPLIQDLTNLRWLQLSSLSLYNQLSSISRKTLQQACKNVARESVRSHWDDKLDCLTVQNKFKDICQLEAENHMWNWIQHGLPAGQLSFLLRAGSDTLPTPLNLKKRRLRVDSQCHLCGSSACSYCFPCTERVPSSLDPINIILGDMTVFSRDLMGPSALSESSYSLIFQVQELMTTHRLQSLMIW